MKFLSAGLTFVNVTTVCGLLAGMASQGLSTTVAIFAALAGFLAALLAFWGTYAAPARGMAFESTEPATTPESKPVRRRDQDGTVIAPASRRYRSTWLWLMVALFAIFAIRSFGNVYFIDGNEYKIQNPNNLGDLSLHLTYIKNFASGVALWPDNPIYVFSKLRYPAGVDLFNALLLLLGVDIVRGLVWVGLLSCVALCYTLYRWGGTFTIAGFLFNGGLAGFQWFKNYQWNDFQGVSFIGWKSLALSMLVTQRGLLYALPVGLLLLYHWRAKFFPRADASNAAETAPPPPLPFWVELTLYATMPLFHLHTFLALSFILLFLFLFRPATGRNHVRWLVGTAFSLGISFVVALVAVFLKDPARKHFAWLAAALFLALGLALMFLFFFLHGPARKQLALLVGAALLPATFIIWLITDRFQAGTILKWNPGWVQNNGDFARPLAAFTDQPNTVLAAAPGFVGTLKHFVQFWVINFGITLPLIIALLVLLVMRAWRRRDEPAAVKVRLISVLVAVAVSVAAFASVFAYFSLGYSLFVVLALIPPIAFAVMIPLFAWPLQKDWRQTVPITPALAFVIPAVVLFLFACFVKTAPWEWDNIKLIIWSYLIVLPFVWSELVSRWPFFVRVAVCVALFGSGFFTLFGGLAAGRTGFGLADRTELDAIGVVVANLPPEARYAAHPTYNHPLLLQGRKVIQGYAGHVWTQGFNHGEDSNKLTQLLNGAPNWKELARYFRTRYLFWGRMETANYPQSTRPWEKESKLVVSGPWGSIYDLESPREPIPVNPVNPVTPGQ